MIEKYSYYEFEIKSHDVPGLDNNWVKGFFYVIYAPAYVVCEESIIRESEEYFDSEQEARFAAIGHIDLLENGEG